MADLIEGSSTVEVFLMAAQSWNKRSFTDGLRSLFLDKTSSSFTPRRKKNVSQQLNQDLLIRRRYVQVSLVYLQALMVALSHYKCVIAPRKPIH